MPCKTLSSSHFVALRRAGSVDNDSERTWLLEVTRRVCSGHRRAAKRTEPLTSDETVVDDQQREGHGAETSAMGRQRSAAIERCLARLPDRQREVLFLVFGEGLTIEQAARVVDVSIGTARTHYHRGKEAMRELLQKEGIEDV